MRARLPVAVLVACALGAGAVTAQPPASSARTRVEERLRVLRQEADRLAGQSRTLLGDIRKLEVERDIRTVESREADLALAAAKEDLSSISYRLDALEQQRLAGLPDLRALLVDTYKRGRSGYLRLLVGAGGLREFARASRAVTALAYRRQRVLAEYRLTVEALRTERATLEAKTRELRAHEAAARQARTLADRAVAARAALVDQIDARRDLAAQYVGELQVARDRIDQQLESLGGQRRPQDLAVPIGPFRGALEWPVPGEVSARFGQPSGRGGAPLVRNGIEVAAPEGASVKAVHGGSVGFADSYTGLGTLVILDHGGNDYSLYGYLSSVSVQRGDTIEAGAEVGRVGPSPAGPPALYFEMRIDGRFVDPVQWLKPR